ncbi:AbrB/MazE/SpoVT family DNA-binding domain-containing protein [Variovorax sp. RHLX14]|uniref:AbrB/MazE/SpoVT family DNA-binding domain-containing protein n=1 Tax=Variovorax sp. RHLX14 TaxID=1259731 RepID=UPI003F4902F7
MHTTNLRKVGGSVMMAVPPAFLDLLNLQAGAAVAMTIEQNRLVIEAKSRTRYSLEELLAQCDTTAPMSAEDSDWIDAAPVGKELL